ncbi:MAG: NAD(P)-dependent oxidoreductase [Caldilineaceae bacterium]|nr:NAD(P)-dependent oxidoreductase [Caldilineaceae bacterium]
MRRLLITGVSGFLGWNIARLARHEWDVMGTYFSVKRQIAQTAFTAIDTGRIDLTDFREMREMMAMVKPHAVIHTAALTDPNYCETHADESFRINVEAARNLAGLCGDREIPFVFTSTDLVFDGTQAPYREDDPITPISVYGEHKAQAEMEILERYALAAVCRMPLMFGRRSPSHVSFLQWMVDKMERGDRLPLFKDEYRTPVDAESAARGLLMIARSALPETQEEEERPPISGRLHLGGPERISRYEFGLLVQEIGQFPNARIDPVNLGDITLAAARPPDVSLDSSRARKLGYDPLPLRAALAQILNITLPQPPATDEEDS